ncbi:hypothetical protein [Ereboglobus sp. PH5-5]|uniref:hypothetical protein n=1 Tax=Ereboglobus sp. PH5-5 TaxID=2940529 RepID=UPI0024063EB6|nr:hypothetical protein [Ereboglobus sp. PH5-5]
MFLFTAGAVRVQGVPLKTDAGGRSFADIALEESVVPVRAGVPGEKPFWNQYAKRFIYAPAFDYKPVRDAAQYRYDVVSENSGGTLSFTAKNPWQPLSPIWAKVPVGYFTITVTGVSADGKDAGTAGTGRYYRAATFAGEYHAPVLEYDVSAKTALSILMHKPFVEHWLENGKPDPAYSLYRYPSKIFSALIIGALTHAKLASGTPDQARSEKIAVITADYLMSLRFKPGTPWEYHTPTYHGYTTGKAKGSNKELMQEYNHMTIMGVDTGNAYLDLYDYTGNRKYFDEAVRIAETYKKRQLPGGSWVLYVNHHTNKPFVERIAIPTQIINYYDRLRTDYGVKGLEESTARALKWIMDVPVKTFDWVGQFEDIKPRKEYGNLSREQACDLAMYLLKNSPASRTRKADVALAEELIRFSEDQFVVWEKPMPRKGKGPNDGANSANWITPCVQEQAVYWLPVGRSAAIMIETYKAAYACTGREIYLAKAKSMANSFTLMQEAQDGNYTTMFVRGKWPTFWLNSVVYPAKTMMRLQESINANFK